jgi:hypothetical protein
VQGLAIRLTDSLSDLQALMFKHYEAVGKVFEVAAPVLSEIPAFREIDFSNAQSINRIIVDSTEKSRKVIDDVREALVTCKVDHLQQYVEDLKAIKATLSDALKNQTVIKQKIVDNKATLEALRHDLKFYAESVDSATDVAFKLCFDSRYNLNQARKPASRR